MRMRVGPCVREGEVGFVERRVGEAERLEFLAQGGAELGGGWWGLVRVVDEGVWVGEGVVVGGWWYAGGEDGTAAVGL